MVASRRRTRYEQSTELADESAHHGAEVHVAAEAHGRRSVSVGRDLEVCIYESGDWALHKVGDAIPALHGDFVAGLEIIGGLLLLSGLFTRLIAIPFVIEMIVAILSTKIALYLGTSPLPLPPALPKVGIWAVLHEVRSEYAQMMTVLFLLINGPGRWSLDALLQERRKGVQVRAGYGSRVLPNSAQLYRFIARGLTMTARSLRKRKATSASRRVLSGRNGP